MKITILSILASLMLIGCTKFTYEDRDYGTKDFINLEKLSGSAAKCIFKDMHTGVLYLSYDTGIAPIMEADGTCLTYDEWITRRTK